MKKAIFLAVSLALLALAVCGCGGGGSPSEVVKAFYKAGNDGDYAKAKDYLSIHTQMALEDLNPTGMSFERGMDGTTKGGTISRIEVKGGQDVGQYAVVYTTLYYRDGTQAEDVVQLLREGGPWKIYSSSLLLTGQFSGSVPTMPSFPTVKEPSQRPESVASLNASPPAVSDTAKIALCSGGAIYVVNADGTGRTKLTDNSLGGHFPAWSPDGKKIAFVSSISAETQEHIYVMNSDGSGQTRLTNDVIGAFQRPAWSPDNNKIAFIASVVLVSSVQSTRQDNLCVMNADGTNLSRLTDSAQMLMWSPDNKKVAFVSKRDSNQEIYVMNADGTKQTRLTVNSADDSHPVWSPDGTRIAFDSDRDRNSEIYVMNADGTKQTRLTNNGAPNFEPAWSPDSKKIAFSSGKMEGNIWIYKIDSDGTNETRLTNNKQDVSPWWSPDGKKLAFYSLQEGERVPYDLYTMDADGSNQIDVFSHLEWYYYEPAWSPIK